MLLSFYKYNLKKKKVFYKLLLYFICFNYKFLFYIYYNFFINIKKLAINANLKYLIISPFILNLFISKNFKFLKKNLIIFCSNNIQIILSLFNNNKLLQDNINIISLNYYFINVKYINKINKWYILFNNNIYHLFILLIKFFIFLQNLIIIYINNN